MPDGFEVVSSGLLNAFVGVDGGIAGSSCQVLTVLIRDVFTFAVFITLCKTEVDDVDLVFGLVSSADQEVVRLDIPVNYSLLVHLLDTHHLNIYG